MHALTFSKLVSRHILCDIPATNVIGGLLARHIYLDAYLGEGMLSLEYASLILVISVLFQIVARQQGLYDSFCRNCYVMIYTCASTFAVTFVMLLFLKAPDFYSDVRFVHWTAIFLVSDSLGRGVFARQIRRLPRIGALQRPIALIGEGPQFSKVKEILLNDNQDFRLANVMEFGKRTALRR